MSVEFRKAVRQGVHVILGFVGSTGSGKTKSALEVAAGLAQGQRFALIDTESERALHYADQYDFDHASLDGPYRPDAYLDAIKTAEAAGYPVVVVDQMSHEHAGEGGLLDWHEEILTEMVERRRHNAEQKGWRFEEWKEREKLTMKAWIEPKTSHKRMVRHLVKMRAHLVLCFRAEPKTKMVPNAKGKTEIVQLGFQPICEKNLPYELIASFLLDPDSPGKLVEGGALKMPEYLAPFFRRGEYFSRAQGERLAHWADAGTESIGKEALLAMIRSATTVDELKSAGAALKRANLPPADADEVVAAGQARRAELQQGGEQ